MIYARTHENVKYIFPEQKNGTAISRYTGISDASNDYIVITDADNQHPPHMINNIAKQLYKDEIRVSYSKTENALKLIDQIQHPTVREALRMLDIKSGI